MTVIKFVHKGDFKNTEDFFKSASSNKYLDILKKYGEIGVRELQKATPIDSGLTSYSWTYTIKESRNRLSVQWTNSNVVDGVNIAIIIQYGHGTGSGGYVEGTDYINPAMKPVFDQIASEMWKEVNGH